MSFIDLKKCFSDPKHILRLIAVVFCISVATYQLSGCFEKIMNPPVNTLYGFDLNKTMKFPAVTMCRNPPYKTSLFSKFNVSSLHKPTTTEFWRRFNFENYTIEDFIKETTYTRLEFIRYSGFTGDGDVKSNLSITSFISLTLGQCYTFIPMNEMYLWSSNSKFSFMLKHSTSYKRPTRSYISDDVLEKNFTKNAETNSDIEKGYHVYIHNPSEMVSDMQFQDDSYMEYIHVDVGEELKVNLRPHEYNQVPTRENKCTPGMDYSKSRCKEECLRMKITDTLKCQSPWLPNSNYPLCSSFEEIRSMLQMYQKPNFNCKCLRSCNIVMNTPYIQSRQAYESPYTIFYIYHSSNLVTQMKEYIAYDWNIFLADLGGSLGFLLGLSVLGVIGVLQSMCKFLYRNLCAKRKDDENKADKEDNPKLEEKGENNVAYFNESKFKEAEASKCAFQNEVNSFNSYFENQYINHNFFDKY